MESYSKTEMLTSQPSYRDLLTPIMRNKIQCWILKHAVNVRLQDNPNLSLFQTTVCLSFLLQILGTAGI